MRRLLAPTALVLGLASTACSYSEPEPTCSDTVVAQARPGYDLSALQTFSIAAAADYPDDLPGDLPDDTQTNLIAANFAAAEELVALGLTEVNPDNETPDAVIFSMVATDTETDVIWACVGGWVWWGWWGYVWDSCAWMEAIEVEYDVGTVVVGLADPVEQAVVFGGVIQGALGCGDASTRIDQGVSRIFDSWPDQ